MLTGKLLRIITRKALGNDKSMVYGAADLGDTIAAHIDLYEKIIVQKEALRKEERKLLDDLRDKRALLEEKRQALYKTYDHPDMIHHGDPSGGSDRYSECMVCGYRC